MSKFQRRAHRLGFYHALAIAPKVLMASGVFRPILADLANTAPASMWRRAAFGRRRPTA